MGQAPSSAAKAEQQSAPDVLESAKKPAPLLESSPLVPGGGTALDAGGEVPLLTWKTIGLFGCYSLTWAHRGIMYTVGFTLFQRYLNAPANVTAAGTAIITNLPDLFSFVPGLLSDCVPLCGSRRKLYGYVGTAIVSLGYLILVLRPFPQAYLCPPGSSLTPVCNPHAPDEAGMFFLLLSITQIGAVIALAGLDGLVLDYARREPIATRGRAISMAVVSALLGASFGVLFAGFALNTREYSALPASMSGTFAHGMSFQGVCAAFLATQPLIVVMLAFNTYEPPLPEGLGASWSSRATAAKSSLSQSADALRTPFLLKVLAVHFLTGLSFQITPPSEIPAVVLWCRVTPLAISITGFAGCFVFAILTGALGDTLPNVSWRRVVLSVSVVAVATYMLTSVLIAYNIVRSPFFALATGGFLNGPGGITTLARRLIIQYVVTELTSGANQATLGSLFVTVDAMGAPLGRAIAEPLYGALRPSMADPLSYLRDTPAFRNVVVIGAAISVCFSSTIFLFIWWLPDSKEQAREGMRTTVARDWLLRPVLAVMGVLVVFAFVMCVAPLFPSLACMPFFGGSGCSEDLTHFVFATREGRSVTGFQ